MHMSCQRKNFLSKQPPEPWTSEWSTRADALNVSFVATHGTRVRLRHKTTLTARARLGRDLRGHARGHYRARFEVRRPRASYPLRFSRFACFLPTSLDPSVDLLVEYLERQRPPPNTTSWKAFSASASNRGPSAFCARSRAARMRSMQPCKRRAAQAGKKRIRAKPLSPARSHSTRHQRKYRKENSCRVIPGLRLASSHLTDTSRRQLELRPAAERRPRIHILA